MELIKFLLWLITGAVIGWFANQMVTSVYGWKPQVVPVQVPSSDKD